MPRSTVHWRRSKLRTELRLLQVAYRNITTQKKPRKQAPTCCYKWWNRTDQEHLSLTIGKSEKKDEMGGPKRPGSLRFETYVTRGKVKKHSGISIHAQAFGHGCLCMTFHEFCHEVSNQLNRFERLWVIHSNADRIRRDPKRVRSHIQPTEIGGFVQESLHE